MSWTSRAIEMARKHRIDIYDVMASVDVSPDHSQEQTITINRIEFLVWFPAMDCAPTIDCR